MKPISPELAQRIQRHVNDLPQGIEAWPVRMCKEKLNALPLHGDQIYLWALRPDGVVLSLDHESASLPVCEETDPLTLYAVLVRGAQKYPELQEVVPRRPVGVQQCEPCSGMGVIDVGKTAPGCMRCRGLGWHVVLRPLDEWLKGIDRGDQLRLQAAGRVLSAGRLAGLYVVKVGDEHWFNPTTTPTAAGARHQLRERLARFEAGQHVTATWRENVAGTNDPFANTEYTLLSHETGTGGSCTVAYTRQPEGDYLKITTLNNDWDSLGSGPPAIQTERLNETEARAELVNQIRRRGFPTIVKCE